MTASTDRQTALIDIKKEVLINHNDMIMKTVTTKTSWNDGKENGTAKARWKQITSLNYFRSAHALFAYELGDEKCPSHSHSLRDVSWTQYYEE